MGKSKLSAPHFHDEAAAFSYLESKLWPDGPVCPKCGGEGYALKGVKDKKGRARLGLKKCRACRAQFTVRIGTVFEDSHAPLHLWLQAIALLAASKKGISANQLHRTLGLTLKTAWFMGHRIREAMRDGSTTPFGGGGGDVEVDETYFGHDPDAPVGKKRNATNKNRVLTLVDRDSGQARSLLAPEFSVAALRPILAANMAKEARLLTDDASAYKTPGRDFAAHGSVKHGVGEYVSATDPSIHTQRVEGFFSVFKRGMRGIYQHCGKQHLHRYTAEFDFRYSNRIKLGVDDATRFAKIVEGVKGKRLTYKAADSKAENLA